MRIATMSLPAAIDEQREPMSLGIFMPNCSYTASISTYKPDPDDWTYESNLRIARVAEAAGFELSLSDCEMARLLRQDQLPGDLARNHDLGLRTARPDQPHPCVFHRSRADLSSAGSGQNGRHHRPHQQRTLGPQRGQRLERARVRHDGYRGPAARRALPAHGGVYRNSQGSVDQRTRHIRSRIEVVPDSAAG
jgi:hypothetical protein